LSTPGPSARFAEGEIVERGDAVGLGPHADRAAAGDVVVVHLDIGLAVEGHLDALAAKYDAKRVPLFGGDRRIDVLERLAAAGRGVVERDVVLEGVGARDVVVVAILPAPHHAARLVLASGLGPELDLDEAVGHVD